MKRLPMSGNVISGKLERQANNGRPAAVPAAVFLEFAEFLATAATDELFGRAPGRITVTSNVSILGATHATALTGKCALMKTVAGLIVGETEIFDDESGRVATVTLNIATIAETVHTDKDRSQDMQPSARLQDGALPDTNDIPAMRRHQIFEAAKRIMIEKGFDRATMREIADEAGLRIPTIYQYFKTKDDLLVMIFDTYLARMESDLRDAIEEKVSATEEIKAAISATLSSIDRHRREILLMTQETRSLQPEARLSVISKLLTYLDIFGSIVKRGVDSGEFRDIDPQLYGNLIPMTCQVWAQRYWSVGKFGITELEKAILEMTLLGISRTQVPRDD